MNVEKLNTICKNIQYDYTQSQIIANLTSVVQNLQNLINQPQQPAHQNNLAAARKKLTEVLSASKMNEYSPLWKQLLIEIGFDNLYGKQLNNHIENIFSKNTITPSTAYKELTEILQKLQQKNQAVENLISSLRTFNIKYEALNEGEGEIAIVIPRLAVNGNLEKFAKELEDLKKIVNDFNELATGSRPEIKLKTISSSEYQILLDIVPTTAVCLVIAIDKIINTYKSIVEIRKNLKELQDIGVPNRNLKGIEDHANSIMEKSISEGIKDLMSKFGQNLDPTRKKEMEVAIKFSMNKLSNRVDSGFNFDIKMKYEENNEKTEGETEPKEKEYYNFIKDKSKDLEFINLTGTKILSLTEAEKEKVNKSKTND